MKLVVKRKFRKKENENYEKILVENRSANLLESGQVNFYIHNPLECCYVDDENRNDARADED